MTAPFVRVGGTHSQRSKPFIRVGGNYITTTPAAPEPPSGLTPNLWASPTGNDSTGTGTSANPFRTIQKLATTLTNGQIGGVRAGTYDSGSSGASILNLTSSNAATQASPKRIVGGPLIGEARPVLRGYINIDASWTSLEGMYIDLATRLNTSTPVPLRLGGSAGEGQAIRDCEITGGNTLAQGILIGGSGFACNNVQITGNIIHDIVGPAPDGPGHGVYHQNGSNLLVQGNVFYQIGVQSNYGGCRAIQVYPKSTNSVVRYNTIDEMTAGIVFGNLGESGVSNNHLIEYNVWSNQMDSLSNDGRNVYDGSGTSGNIIRSNHIFACDYIGSPSGTTYEGTQTGGDPLYVNRGARNYRLNSGSPAAGKGAYAAPTPPSL